MYYKTKRSKLKNDIITGFKETSSKLNKYNDRRKRNFKFHLLLCDLINAFRIPGCILEINPLETNQNIIAFNDHISINLL